MDFFWQQLQAIDFHTWLQYYRSRFNSSDMKDFFSRRFHDGVSCVCFFVLRSFSYFRLFQRMQQFLANKITKWNNIIWRRPEIRYKRRHQNDFISTNHYCSLSGTFIIAHMRWEVMRFFFIFRPLLLLCIMRHSYHRTTNWNRINLKYHAVQYTKLHAAVQRKYEAMHKKKKRRRMKSRIRKEKSSAHNNNEKQRECWLGTRKKSEGVK